MPRDQIQPLSEEQCKALIRAAARSKDKARNRAIVLLLINTGLRASELCGLRLSDIDWDSSCVRVLGKGNKMRSVPFGPLANKALWDYLRSELVHPRDFEADDIVFHSQRGTQTGAGMERHGLARLITRLGKSAGIKGVRCSPHTLRHTFAVMFLRAPASSVYSLQEILGHTDLKMTRRYVNFVDADILAQHKRCSPVEAMLGSKTARGQHR